MRALEGGGYEPVTGEHGTIRLRNCPFDALTDAHRPLVCGTNLALAEGTVRRPIRGLFLVSVPFWGADFEDFALPPDFAARLPPATTFLYHSLDDPEVSVASLRRYERELPDATSRPIAGSEHSFVRGLPILVDDIKSL